MDSDVQQTDCMKTVICPNCCHSFNPNRKPSKPAVVETQVLTTRENRFLSRATGGIQSNTTSAKLPPPRDSLASNTGHLLGAASLIELFQAKRKSRRTSSPKFPSSRLNVKLPPLVSPRHGTLSRTRLRAPTTSSFTTSVATSGQLHGSPALTLKQLHDSPAPTSGQLHGSPAPTSGQLHGSPAPTSDQLHDSPAPTSGQLHGSPAPTSGQLHGSPAPTSDQLHDSPAPTSGQLHDSPAPTSGQLHGSQAPTSGQLHGSPAPTSGQLHDSPAPRSGQLHDNPAPTFNDEEIDACWRTSPVVLHKRVPARRARSSASPVPASHLELVPAASSQRCREQPFHSKSFNVSPVESKHVYEIYKRSSSMFPISSDTSTIPNVIDVKECVKCSLNSLKQLGESENTGPVLSVTSRSACSSAVKSLANQSSSDYRKFDTSSMVSPVHALKRISGNISQEQLLSSISYISSPVLPVASRSATSSPVKPSTNKSLSKYPITELKDEIKFDTGPIQSPLHAFKKKSGNINREQIVNKIPNITSPVPPVTSRSATNSPVKSLEPQTTRNSPITQLNDNMDLDTGPVESQVQSFKRLSANISPIPKAGNETTSTRLSPELGYSLASSTSPIELIEATPAIRSSIPMSRRSKSSRNPVHVIINNMTPLSPIQPYKRTSSITDPIPAFSTKISASEGDRTGSLEDVNTDAPRQPGVWNKVIQEIPSPVLIIHSKITPVSGPVRTGSGTSCIPRLIRNPQGYESPVSPVNRTLPVIRTPKAAMQTGLPSSTSLPANSLLPALNKTIPVHNRMIQDSNNPVPAVSVKKTNVSILTHFKPILENNPIPSNNTPIPVIYEELPPITTPLSILEGYSYLCKPIDRSNPSQINQKCTGPVSASIDTLPTTTGMTSPRPAVHHVIINCVPSSRRAYNAAASSENSSPRSSLNIPPVLRRPERAMRPMKQSVRSMSVSPRSCATMTSTNRSTTCSKRSESLGASEKSARCHVTTEAVEKAMTFLKNDHWEVCLSGLKEAAQLASEDPRLLDGHMTTVNRGQQKLLSSQRSAVVREAARLTGDLFRTMRCARRPEFDDIASLLLKRTADVNRFIQRDVNMALDEMVTYIAPALCVRVLYAKINHQNSLVRTAVIRLMTCVVLLAGPDKILTRRGNAATRKCVLQAVATLLEDACLETRTFTRELYKLLRTYKDFDAIFESDVSAEVCERLERITSQLKNQRSQFAAGSS